VVSAAVLSLIGAMTADLPSVVVAASPAQAGSFGPLFVEPGPNCPPDANNGQSGDGPAGPPGTPCKPAAVSAAVLPGGAILYWDGLEGMEDIQYSTALEYGKAAGCDESRVLSLRGAPSWSTPRPADGTCSLGYQPTYLVQNPPPPVQLIVNQQGNAPDALFCSSLVFLRGGRVFTAGGTDYYEEPGVPGTPYGAVELEGTKTTRVFNPVSGTWTRLADMNFGRWYPSLVTLPDGDIFVASGVTKLVKPVYPGQPANSFTNVKQTETYSLSSGTWAYDGASGDRSLPLYPRLHLLPDGKVYYDAGGQVFNPFGQSFDEALWNQTAVYNPRTRSWATLAVPGLPGAAPGFRGSTFSIALPLAPPYSQASFLTAGGIVGTTPGTYISTTDSRITTIDTAHGDAFSWHETGPLNNPRWYTSGVLLPDGKVFAVSGADRDEVIFPGGGFAVHQAEIFDPATGRWTAVASEQHDRTYHNSAVLLPTGQVLVGGHAPIATGYGASSNLPGASNNFRDATFEIYNPPYLFFGARPVIAGISTPYLRFGRSLTIATRSASAIANVMLVRNTAFTHLTDADQRALLLPIVGRTSSTITVMAPPSANVAPDGPYMLFINAASASGLIPSVAAQLYVTG
jgi:hypothetical protein